MKKIVIVFGLISGLIVTSLMIINVVKCYHNEDFESSMVLGYASMLLAFSFIFVGVKSFRDKHNNGIISFGKANSINFYSIRSSKYWSRINCTSLVIRKSINAVRIFCTICTRLIANQVRSRA
ncbi:MAG: DUF4199 family protein [Sphingobacteriaceae bacterium]|nr:MAG: DUF4199 family protein [Sphingobacteriaceae bacterium]